MPNIISPLGAIVKLSGDIRLIHDCSRPTGGSLKDHAAYDSIHFQSLDDARQFITPGCWMAKVDLTSAYRSVRIHRSNYCATGIAWTFEGDKEETILTDVRLPFGVKRSLLIFDRLSKAVVAIMRSKGFNQILNYLDDYFVIEPTRERCLLCLHGVKRSLLIFDRLSKAVVAIMRSKGFNQILNYLDDYLVIEPTRERCLLCLHVLTVKATA